MTQVLFDRLKSNLAQCINDGTIYFVKDSNGNFTQIALGDGSKSHVVGIGPKMDDATKQELMSKLGLTTSANMDTIQLGKLSNQNGVSSQKMITYERTGLGTDIHEISTVGYVQQYMKTAKAMVYAGLFNAQTKEITDYNNAIISPSGEGNVTFDYLLNGNEGETLLTSGMSFIVGTAGNLEGYTGINVYGGATNVEVGDMIIIIKVEQKEGEEGGSTYNEASILIIHNKSLDITEFKSGIIYDVSAHNNGAVFESLQAILSSADLSTLIPTSVRHGGMSIRFIQSSDNKYVQYRLMRNTFSVTESDWQGVDDIPKLNSNNLITSGAVEKTNACSTENINAIYIDGYLNTKDNTIDASNISGCTQPIHLVKGDTIVLYTKNSYKGAIAVVKNGDPISVGSTIQPIHIVEKGTLSYDCVSYTAPLECYVILSFLKEMYKIEKKDFKFLSLLSSPIINSSLKCRNLNVNCNLEPKFLSVEDNCCVASNGNFYPSSYFSSVEYDVSEISIIAYSRLIDTSGHPNSYGIAFYDSNKTTVLSFQGSILGNELGTVLSFIPVPQGAKYARVTFWKNEYKNGRCIFQAVSKDFLFHYLYNNRTTFDKNTGDFNIGDSNNSYSCGDKLIKLYGWSDSRPIGIQVNDVYYNSAHKKLYKIVEGSPDYKHIPYYKGAIYQYDNNIYIWDGSDLINICDRYFEIDWQKTNRTIPQEKLNVGQIYDGSDQASETDVNYSIITAKKGDVIIVSASDFKLRVFAVLDKNNTILQVSSENSWMSNQELICPENTFSVIIQGKSKSKIKLSSKRNAETIDNVLSSFPSLIASNFLYYRYSDNHCVITEDDKITERLGFGISDFIDVSAYNVGDELQYWAGVLNSTQILYLTQYKADKSYNNSAWANTDNPRIVPIRENTKYVRVSFKKESAAYLKDTNGNVLFKWTSIMINGGTLSDGLHEEIPSIYPMEVGYKKTQQQTDVEFVTKGAIPFRDGTTTNTNEMYKGVIYSETMEIDKRVGWDVSLLTYVTAINNPYSLIYTENISATRSRSAYGITYHGDANSGAYYGSVCNTFALLGCSPLIPYTTPQINGYDGGAIRGNNLFELVYDQSIRGLQLMDLFVMPGHVQVVTKLFKDSRNTNKLVQLSEENGIKAVNGPLMNEAQFEDFKTKNAYRVFRFKELYKNIYYEESPVVHLMDEITTNYVFNNDICTIYGDYACIKEDDILHISYNKGNYTSMQIYKNDVLLETITLDADSNVHDVDLSQKGYTYGKYKACLTDGINNSEFTYWEMINVEMSLNGDTLSFSSTNGKPIYWDWQKQSGGSYRPVLISDEDILAGEVDVSERSALYNYCIKVHVQGDYGRVARSLLNNI